jgi:hypothetical protein
MGSRRACSRRWAPGRRSSGTVRAAQPSRAFGAYSARSATADQTRIYPSNDRLVTAFKDDLARYEVNGKGTIRFPLSEPVPVKLIAGIAKFRAKVAAARAKATAPKKPYCRNRADKRHPDRGFFSSFKHITSI